MKPDEYVLDKKYHAGYVSIHVQIERINPESFRVFVGGKDVGKVRAAHSDEDGHLGYYFTHDAQRRLHSTPEGAARSCARSWIRLEDVVLEMNI